ncbi:DUF2268 domain-containing putative Zn-dependent protease [Metapseudomonas furukawaii]
MQLHLHILDADGTLAPWNDRICQEAERIARLVTEKVPKRFHTKPVDVVVEHLAEATIPELGIGGRCYRRNLVTIELDPHNERFEESLKAGALGETLAHELHHSMRHGTCGYGSSLGDALVSEGLADLFTQELTGCGTPIYCDAVDKARWPETVSLAEAFRDRFDHDHWAWFAGTGTLPRWAGYTLGYRLVQSFRALHPELPLHDLIDIPSERIISAAWIRMKQYQPA